MAGSWSPENMSQILYNMAVCHSLEYRTHHDDELCGNPVDVAMFKRTRWVYNTERKAISRGVKCIATAYPPANAYLAKEEIPVMLEVHRVFPFESHHKRMSVIARSVKSDTPEMSIVQSINIYRQLIYCVLLLYL